jgi:catalase
MKGLKEAPRSSVPHEPYVEGKVMRQKISRANDYQQAGERYRTFNDFERDNLILNLITQLKKCNPDIQERMIGHLTQCDLEYGARVQAGLQQK